jgi:hypothetical protein
MKGFRPGSGFMTGLGGPAAQAFQVQLFEMTAVRAVKPSAIDGTIDEEKWRGRGRGTRLRTVGTATRRTI